MTHAEIIHNWSHVLRSLYKLVYLRLNSTLRHSFMVLGRRRLSVWLLATFLSANCSRLLAVVRSADGTGRREDGASGGTMALQAALIRACPGLVGTQHPLSDPIDQTLRPFDPAS